MVYETYVEALMQLAQKTGNKAYAERAFVISEKARAKTLLDQLIESNKLHLRKNDTSLIAEFRNLQQNLNAAEYEYEQRIFNKAPEPHQKVALSAVELLKSQLQDLEGRMRIANQSLAGLLLPPELSFDKFIKLIDKDSGRG